MRLKLRAAVMLCICAANHPAFGYAAHGSEMPDGTEPRELRCAPQRVDVSGPGNDYNLSFSADGHVSAFARSDAGFANSKIYVRYGAGAAPRIISFSDSRWRDSDPWLTPDGRTLYFISDRPPPSRPDARDLNIWRSHHQQDGSWSGPEYLGDAINSVADELGPELHGDLLYFGSDRAGGMGGLDIYQVHLGGRAPAEPERLPSPINSSRSESDFTISPNGRTALFWRLVDGRALLHRSELAGTWGEPTALPAQINLGEVQFTPAFSPSGRLIFASTAVRQGQPAGLADLYETDLECRSGDQDGEAP